MSARYGDLLADYPPGVDSRGGGLYAPAWAPAVPGLAALYCTNTAAFPNAVAFPADPLVNGNFEGAAGPPPNGWTAWHGTATREAGTRTGGGGSFVGQLAYDGANAGGMMYEVVLTANNTYVLNGWVRSVDGVSIPIVDTNVGGLAWNGTNSTSWQQIPTTTFTTLGTQFRLRCENLAAGRAVQFDDITITPRNTSQFTDLTGNGRHLLQATAASQPLWVASGAGGVLRFDGVADYLKTAAFTLNQPEHIFLLTKWTSVAGAPYILDGNAMNGMGLYDQAGATASVYAGKDLLRASTITGTWGIIDVLYNGAASAIGLNGGLATTGDAGTNNAGGITVCRYGGAAGGYGTADIAALAVYSRPLSELDRQRVVRWLQRQGRLLGVL